MCNNQLFKRTTLNSTSNILTKNFIFKSGERYCQLVDKNKGLPLYHPNLFVTTQIRNRSMSHSAMTSALGGITVLLSFMTERGDDIENRFRKNEFFETHELDALRDYCQIKFKVRTTSHDINNVFTLIELQGTDEKVGSQTIYIRLTVIKNYIKWLAGEISGNNQEKNVALRIGRMVKEVEARRPIKRNRNNDLDEKCLDEKQLDVLFEIFRPGSELNAFKDKSVMTRNRLIFLLLYDLGLRGGELLNIRIKDIDFANNQIVLPRRADEKDDPRTEQPLVKTRDRRIPLKASLVKEIHSYILNGRKLHVKAGQPDFLFITHKSGPTKGQPLSKSGYQKIMAFVRMTSPILYNLTGHKLRHTWNERFSENMDNMDNPPSEEHQEEMRSYLMGWVPGSGTAATYNKRFIRKKGLEAALRLQEGMVRLPKGMTYE